VLRRPIAGLLFATVALAASVRSGDDAAVQAWLDAHVGEIVALQHRIHASPEVAFEETRTAALVAETLESAGYAVTSGVGRTGVVGILKNGDGPTVLVRGDMDALPMTEASGLPYASATPGVMHACGHDVHVASLLGTAQVLAALRARWRGTVVMLAQPAEETGRGALAMIDDGLATRIPKPDALLALHVKHDLPAGSVGFTSGWWAATVDSVDVVIHGRGSHGARPEASIDPVVVSAYIVTALQTLVSRNVPPGEGAVVTIGSIHGGTKRSVIPDEVKLELTVRSYTPEVRRTLLDGIRRIATDTCRAFGCPREPTFTVEEEPTPSAWNDPALTAQSVAVLREALGADAVVELPAEMIGEDFGRYSGALGAPAFLFRVGVASPARVAAAKAAGEELPSLHSARFVADSEPTLATSVRAMADLVLALLAAPSGS
jgi:hippurate hydrolase